MQINMSHLDARIRTILAIVMLATAALLVFASIGPVWVPIVLAIFALVFLVTSRFRTCPLYMPFGIKTCKD